MNLPEAAHLDLRLQVRALRLLGRLQHLYPLYSRNLCIYEYILKVPSYLSRFHSLGIGSLACNAILITQLDI